ncbi:hypothetical protein [uncultured Massilia sp.]|uniref:hypothetical protein n=1 Tax=uncultured Massilia sp. TaxID=169973 RepID=UPI0025D9119B|nr:hypothetical protein [uncultured Massilia sp.]
MYQRSVCLLLAILGLDCAAAADYPASIRNTKGDQFQLRNNVYGLKPLSLGVDSSVLRCAGKFSIYTVDKVTDTETYITFISVNDPFGNDTCPAGAPKAWEGSQYSLPNTTYSLINYKTSGIAYGALIVPFKFHLGNDKKLSASSTIAPYLGIRWRGLQYLGAEATPIFSAGLGLVPVSDAASGKTETKAAFSTAIGVTVSSIKSMDFNAGFLFGKDFVNRAERGTDAAVNKPWISVWVGISK